MSQMHWGSWWIASNCCMLVRHGWKWLSNKTWMFAPLPFPHPLPVMWDSSFGEWALLAGIRKLRQAPLFCLVDLIGCLEAQVSVWECVLPGQASGPGSLANQLWQVPPTAAVAGWASRWLNNPAFWPARVFDLEPFSWNRAEAKTAVCSLTTAWNLWADGPPDIMNCPLIFPRPLKPRVITHMPLEIWAPPFAWNGTEISLFSGGR